MKSLFDTLDLEQVDETVFRSARSMKLHQANTFGGQILGQAVVAGARTVDGMRPMHSLRAHFTGPAVLDQPIDYSVDVIREGRSFSSRAVTAVQSGREAFRAVISYHRQETGWQYQNTPPIESFPAAPGIDDPSLNDDLVLLHPNLPEILVYPTPSNVNGGGANGAALGGWFKVSDEVGPLSAMHQAVLALFSDWWMLEPAFAMVGVDPYTGDYQVLSLDHALWYHREFDLRNWTYLHLETPIADAARVFCLGKFFARDGALVASCTQEGLIRKMKVSPS